MLRDNKKSGIIVSVFLVLFFSYGHVFHLIYGRQIGNFTFVRERHLMVPWALIFICVFFYIMKTRRDLHNLTNILNIIAFSLVVISLINIGVYGFKTRSIWEDSRNIEDKKKNTADLGDESILRDIYYIILDGYASSSTLEEIYNYDNHKITDSLTKKGFYVAFNSRSNYALTFLSLASSLNMKYVNYLSERVGVESKNRILANRMIQNNKVMKFLKSAGYKFIHFSSGKDATDRNRIADLDIECGWSNEFLTILIQTTMLDFFRKYFLVPDYRERILGTFSKLGKMHKIKGPKFIFAHIISPHPPHVFGPNGEKVIRPELKMQGRVWVQRKHYLDELTFINKKIEKLIDEILSKSDVSPIIILQADHGTASTFYYPDLKTQARWEHPTETNLKERMGILNAYHLPAGGNDLLYDSITPVNTFRLIFNYYFDTDYKLLDDYVYYSNYEQPYKFINVTDVVNKKEKGADLIREGK